MLSIKRLTRKLGKQTLNEVKVRAPLSSISFDCGRNYNAYTLRYSMCGLVIDSRYNDIMFGEYVQSCITVVDNLMWMGDNYSITYML